MKERITQSTIHSKVSKVLEQLPINFVVCINYKRSKGMANVNIGGTKTELVYNVYDSNLDNWTHQKPILSGTFEDSDGISRWAEKYYKFKKNVEELKQR